MVMEVKTQGQRMRRGAVWNSWSLVVRGVGLRNIIVVFAIGVELHTSATGQAAAALDLPRLAGLASEGMLACTFSQDVSHALLGSMAPVVCVCRVGPTMRCACISLSSGSVVESHGPLRYEVGIASHWALLTVYFFFLAAEGGGLVRRLMSGLGRRILIE